MLDQLFTAMLAVVFAAAMLVAGGLYIDRPNAACSSSAGAMTTEYREIEYWLCRASAVTCGNGPHRWLAKLSPANRTPRRPLSPLLRRPLIGRLP